MKIKKRVIAATFHAVVAFSYLILWIAKWSATPYVIPPPKHDWDSPAAIAINEIIFLDLQNQDCYISIYDNIFHHVSNELGTDWRLMSAIGYVESRFKPYITSRSGAMGIMQIMPRTARIHSITPDQAIDPEVNIRIASLHYNLIDYMLGIPKHVNEEDRIAFNLACYNGGIGRVRDAQRLTRLAGGNSHSWSDVSEQLLNLRDPEYYELEVVHNGRFATAGHTISYVNQVMRRYKLYCEQTSHCTHHLYPIIGHQH